MELCQVRDVTGTVKREYLSEGEFVPGSSPLALYYGVDQIGSVRRVFGSDGSAIALSYDSYGNPLQGTVSATDLGYAGMFVDKDNGLNLTLYRGYAPNTGRWLSRDPSGELINGGTNLYAYAENDPIRWTDPMGLCPMCLVIPAVCAGGGCEALGALGLGALWWATHPFDLRKSPYDPPRAPPSTPSGPDCDSGDDCEEEWAEAYAICKAELAKPHPNPRMTGGVQRLAEMCSWVCFAKMWR
jgi:RHS repeat-associated protein